MVGFPRSARVVETCRVEGMLMALWRGGESTVTERVWRELLKAWNHAVRWRDFLKPGPTPVNGNPIEQSCC
jgi:hypothetical protein